MAAMIVVAAGLSVGASACGSDDDPDDPGTPTETLDDLTDTDTTVLGGVTETTVLDLTDPTSTGG